MKKTVFYSRSRGSHPLLLVSLLILILATVFSGFTDYSNYIIMPLWAIWLAYVVSEREGFSKNEKTFVIVSFAYLALVFIYRFVGYSSMVLLGLLENLNWIMAGVVAIYVMKKFSERELSTTYQVLAISLFALMLVFIRQGRGSLAIGDDYEAVSVANAWYGSLFMLLSGLSLIVFLNVKKFLPRFVAIVVLILTVYLNIGILQRGTNVIMTAAELALILLFLVKRKSVTIPILVVIAIFVVFAFSSDNMVYIFDWLSQVSPSERLARRFEEISMAMAYESIEAGGGSFSARGDLMATSWNTFSSSFGHIIFGAGEHAGSNNVIGHHSFFLDTLARYGVIGGGLIFVYFLKQYQIMMSYLDRNKEWALYMQCTIVFAFYVLRNFYGEVAYTLVNFVVLLFFPLTFQLIHYYQNKSK